MSDTAPMDRAPAAAGRLDAATRRGLLALGAISVALGALRAVAAVRVGYGDSEALYASYALHPQPAYLDHPGLVALVARAVGGGTAPSPERAHAVTAVAATLWPWLGALVCRACGAPWGRSLAAAAILALVPEIAVGLFAMTPDLPLSFAWLGAIGAAAYALERPPGSVDATAGFAAAGLLAGVAATAKVSGALLLVSLAAAYASTPARRHARTIAPWAGLAAGVLTVAPVVVFEARTGWPMLRHRLIDTQAAAGPSLRNAAALVGGQLAYLSPLVVVLVVVTVRAAWTDRRTPVGALLLATSALPGAILGALCLWSRVAEPHWLAPAGLALVPAAARARDLRVPGGRRFVVAAAAVAGAMVAATYAWVLVPALLRLAPASYDARLDIANELYGWDDVARTVHDDTLAVRAAGIDDVVVVGPHWVICAQLEAAFAGTIPVGCDTPIADDFDAWRPRAAWRQASAIVWVSDRRFAESPPPLASFDVAGVQDVRVERAGRVVRRFTVTILTRSATALGRRTPGRRRWPRSADLRRERRRAGRIRRRRS